MFNLNLNSLNPTTTSSSNSKYNTIIPTNLNINTSYNDSNSKTVVPTTFQLNTDDFTYTVLTGGDSDDDDDNNDKHNNETSTSNSNFFFPNKNELQKRIKSDYITQFYVGSLTVIGLFILFRMIQKSK